jgi:hypothetical protein
MIVVDRIEGDQAVLDVGGRTVDVPLAVLPEGVREGDRLTFVVAPADTSEADARLARLRAKTPQGPGSFDL